MEGQCGVESSLLVLRPTPIIELHDAAVAEVVAGKLHSGAVTNDGDAWTWGDGKAGKLGHGTADRVPAPNRVSAPFHITPLSPYRRLCSYSMIHSIPSATVVFNLQKARGMTGGKAAATSWPRYEPKIPCFYFLPLLARCIFRWKVS